MNSEHWADALANRESPDTSQHYPRGCKSVFLVASLRVLSWPVEASWPRCAACELCCATFYTPTSCQFHKALYTVYGTEQQSCPERMGVEALILLYSFIIHSHYQKQVQNNLIFVVSFTYTVFNPYMENPANCTTQGCGNIWELRKIWPNTHEISSHFDIHSNLYCQNKYIRVDYTMKDSFK